MKKWIKYIIYVCIIVICIPIFIDFVILGNKFPSNVDNNAWIGFLGSYVGALIGAAITLVGVIMTINYTRKEAKEDRRLSIAPYIKYDIQKETLSHKHDLSIFDVVDDDYNTLINNTIIIKNIGLGPLVGIYITDMYFNKKKCCYDRVTAVPGILEKGEQILLLIDIRMKLEEIPKDELVEVTDSTIGLRFEPPEKYKGKGGYLKFIVHYGDLLGNRYQQNVEVSISISLIGDISQTKWEYSKPEISIHKISDAEIVK